MPDVGHTWNCRFGTPYLTPLPQQFSRMLSSATVVRPHNLEAERTTIGALLLDPDRIIDVAPAVSPADFYDPVFRTIFTAICDLHEKRKVVDFVTVADALRTDAAIQSLGGSAFLAG